MNEFRTELLAPAGTFEALIGAVNAGADAIYLGGEKFGARAYAGNFSKEELLEGLEYAHLFNKKIYLTLNTLIKESEFGELYNYLLPFYEASLDGIIIQDVGVMSFVKKNFPNLPIHVSTQAFVTGPDSALFYKELGATRVVPARELSLDEIIKIKEETGLEVETFIHGAMCYCYSGQCLFSSIVGGRSGNRGRCAQPCRLPYDFKVNNKSYFAKESYPLSLKDMCTVFDLLKLLGAGIDSFKIEGRMKKPEYVAGVVSIYRKYMDMYYDNPSENVSISKEDERILRSLYIRSEIQNGYYFKHNGKDMITLSSPAYSGSDDKLLEDIRAKYLTDRRKAPVSFKVYCHVNELLSLTLKYGDKEIVVNSLDVVSEAMNRAATEDDLYKSLSKLGNTNFYLKDFKASIKGNCFVPVKILNELRRQAIEGLNDTLKDANMCHEKTNIDGCIIPEVSGFEAVKYLENTESNLEIYIEDYDQLKAIKKLHDEGLLINKLFVEYNLCNTLNEKDLALFKDMDSFIALPYVLRAKDDKVIKGVLNWIDYGYFKGILCRNPEELGYVIKTDFKYPVVLDAGLYSFNMEAFNSFKTYGCEITLPLELNGKEKRNMISKETSRFTKCVVGYGRVPMMITANCLFKTSGLCGKDNDLSEGTLIDRLSNDFPVKRYCSQCMNVIYNCLPTSIHKEIGKYRDCNVRLCFTTEKFDETLKVISLYSDLLTGKRDDISNDLEKVIPGYTTGHEKRGVE